MSPETVKLEDAMLAIIDYRGKTPPKSDSGKWLVTAKVVKDGFIREQPKEFIAASEYDNWMRRGLPELGDVLVTTEAPLGQVAAIRSTADIALAQRLILLRADPDVLCQDFLLYSMQAPFVQHQLQARATGTTVLGIKQSELRKIQLPKPPMPSQLAVARALRSFDDLIENNRRRIEILEEMARLLYREWFVHFRFPGHEDVELVDSELGPLPEGWVVARFSGLVTESKKSVAEDEILPGSALIGLEHLPRRSTTLTEWDVAENVGSRRKLFASGDILFGKIRPYFHKVVDAPMEGYASTDAIVFRPSRYPERALSVASSDEFVATAVATSNGTKMPRANTDLLLDYAIPEPPPLIAAEFEKRVAPASALRRNLSQQNRVLWEARDLLLPRLVSGELDVSELDLDGVLA